MRNISNMGGLFARQKATDRIRSLISLMRSYIKRGNWFGLLAVILVTMSACHQKTAETNSDDILKQNSAASKDSLEKPKVSIQVNRRYDEKGNMIGFDSTYSSFYSNVTGDTAKMDTLMQSFNRYFNRNHSSFLDRQFEPLFFEDSLRYPDFFHRDYFMKRYELNDNYLRGTMRRMDSIKNQFFYEHSKTWKDSKDLK